MTTAPHHIDAPAEARVYTMQQITRALQCSREIVHKLRREGRVRGFKLGNQWRFRAEDVDRIIAQDDRD